ncbi:hypothetical protein [Neptuniibacter sp. CAU 1671]|uniref:hypothetical protein n=1 Tax=Neptuniibacter sp. CAU 1671 TaxID=3032593 RepID=UPI0023DC1855|nr:hypothetical protein [Neptuniibacter sp. CAU 1671]MDF2182607.1 hypothetical protein [Neptuniibacter sp. CAU 1671]
MLKNKFNNLLADYLNTFNFIELNVGLCIRHLSPLGLEESDKKLEKMSFERKLECLMDLSPVDSKRDLHEWCADAHEKRHERNMYMHGQWAFLPHLEEGVEFLIAPWMKQKYAAVYPGSRFSLEHLEIIVSELQACFKSLQLLRRKYGI